MKIISLKDYFTLNEQAPNDVTNWLRNQLSGVKSGNAKNGGYGRLLSDDEINNVVDKFKQDEQKVNNKDTSMAHAREIVQQYTNKTDASKSVNNKARTNISTNDTFTDNNTGDDFKHYNTYLNGKNTRDIFNRVNKDKKMVSKVADNTDKKGIFGKPHIDKSDQVKYGNNAAFDAEIADVNKVLSKDAGTDNALSRLLKRFVRNGDNVALATHFVDRFLTWDELNKGANNEFVKLFMEVPQVDTMIKDSRDFIDLYNEYCEGKSSDFYTGAWKDNHQDVIDDLNELVRDPKKMRDVQKNGFTNAFRKIVKHDENHQNDDLERYDNILTAATKEGGADIEEITKIAQAGLKAHNR